MRRSLFAVVALAACSRLASAQFTMQDSTTTADLRGIASVGDGVAWASGTHGTVLRTEDGGFVWQGCAMPPDAAALDFRGIQAFDAQTALVMSSGRGPLSRVYKTTDGCRTWKLVFTDPDAEGFFDAMQMEDGSQFQSGWIVGDPVKVGPSKRFALFRTNNGGQAWAPAFSDWETLHANQEQGLFAASNTSLESTFFSLHFVTGNPAQVIDLSIPGRSMYDLTVPRHLPRNKLEEYVSRPTATSLECFGSPTPTSGAFSIASSMSLRPTLVIVGGDYAMPGEAPCALTNVSGKWTASSTFPHGYRSSVAYDTATKTWITVGPNGTDISRDDGRNWSPLRPAKDDQPDADKHWNALSLPFAVGPGGRIGRLRDGALAASPVVKAPTAAH